MPPMPRSIVFHKPYGVLTQFSDRSATPRPTLKDFIPIPGVYAAGRLDLDSEGLLLLTSDGRLQHRLSDPRFEHPKTYWVQVEGIPTEPQLTQLSSGVLIQGYKTLPARVTCLPEDPPVEPRDPPIRFRKSIPASWIELTIREGKNRQVRHMTATVGLPTLRLIRVAIGPVLLGALKQGEWRNLNSTEIASLNQV